MKRLCICFILSALSVAIVARAESGTIPAFPDTESGKARASCADNELVLGNDVIQSKWKVSNGGLVLDSVADLLRGESFAVDRAAFQIVLRGGTLVSAKEMTVVGPPRVEVLEPDPDARIYSERIPGRAIAIDLAHAGSGLKAEWRGILRDGSNYVRQQVILTATKNDIGIDEVVLLELPLHGAHVAGNVQGSPVVSAGMFFAFEHPLSDSTCEGNVVRCGYQRKGTLRKSSPHRYSSVIGVVPENQMRRGFLHYLERERAHPYRPFLHYNSWYHLNISRPDNRMTEEEVLAAVSHIGRELVTKRNVEIDSFVLDDGWDDFNSLWDFHDGFPKGFAEVAGKAREFNASVGVWMSPWGGYGGPRKMRLKYGRRQGFETNKAGFSMAGPKYSAAFRDTCLRMIRDYGANYFKFDGMGGGTYAEGAAEELADDIAAILNLTEVLREERHDLFINATTGTWPSPFWVRYADSIWRQGSDTGFAGVGNHREQWLTYRDKFTYERIVKGGPLFPLNSLMIHGLVIGERANPKRMALDGISVRHEIRTMFGSGTGLQELYISPHLLTRQMWDDLADAAKWARKNADILVDAHWIGGSPGELEVYGWAAWTPRAGTVTLRNPDSKIHEFSLDVAKAFEHPAGVSTGYVLQSPYEAQRIQSVNVNAGTRHVFRLEPFEVLVFDALPVNGGE